MLRVPLHREFRYIHEPLPAGDPAIPPLGHERLVDALRERLTYSHGGAFLVSGFRGVGKSTLVLRALAATGAGWGDRDAMLVVHLNVARSMTTDQLLFAVVRRIFESLDDRDLLGRLPREVQRSLLLAYSRTSLSFTQTQSESSERGATLGVAPQSRLAPTVNFSGRKTRSQATEAAFLAYSETDVEHDLIRIVHLLAGIEGRPERAERLRLRTRVARRMRTAPGRVRSDGAQRLRVHPVVVLDEVDKLTDNRDDAIAHFEGLLGRIKNVLTARGAHFVVVAGPDLHDRAVQDADRGNGVYESVFGWRMYVPCLWDAPERLVRGLAAAGRAELDRTGPQGWFARSLPPPPPTFAPYVPPYVPSYGPPYVPPYGPSYGPPYAPPYASPGFAPYPPPTFGTYVPPPPYGPGTGSGFGPGGAFGTAGSPEAPEPPSPPGAPGAFGPPEAPEPPEAPRVPEPSAPPEASSGSAAPDEPGPPADPAEPDDSGASAAPDEPDEPDEPGPPPPPTPLGAPDAPGPPFGTDPYAASAAPHGPQAPAAFFPGPPADRRVPLDDDAAFDRLIGYLRFKARGVPRRLLQEFNALVVWDGGQPSLLVDDAEWERISFYADLEEVVSRATRAGERGASGRVAVDDDRALLGGYHVVDWALRSRGRPFTSADVTGADGIDPLLRMAQSAVERMLRRLARAGVLDVVSESGRPDATRYGRAGSALAYYKLSDAYRRQLAGFARAGDGDRAEPGPVDQRRGAPDSPAGPPPLGSYGAPGVLGRPAGTPYPSTSPLGTGAAPAWPPPGELPDAWPAPAPTPAVGVLADRYEMTTLLGQGGMGAVYRGRDVLTGQLVAVKVMHGALRDDVEMRARFEREVRISAALNHPHIVHTLDTLTGPDVEPALIMELIDGPSLGDVLERHGGLPAPLVARLARQLGEALAFIDGVGVSRIDLKPGNVLLHPQRGAVIIDLGIARPRLDADAVTQVGMVIGTPGYMAPEQVNGAAADIRADLFTLGLILHQSLTGRPVWPVATAAQLFFHIVNDDVEVDTLPASGELRQVIGRLLARAPHERPRDPEEFLALLAETPEAREDPGDDDLLSALPEDDQSPPPGPLRYEPAPPAPTTIVVDG